MINLIFWNADINDKCKSSVEKNHNIDKTIIDLIDENKCDILVLAEYDLDINALCDKISLLGTNFKIGPIAEDVRVKFLYNSRFKVELIRDSNYYFICNIANYLEFNFLLAGVHFPSKSKANSKDIGLTGGDLIKDIHEAEESVEHKNVIMIGDFNSAPFEDVMIDADKIHAIPYADIVEKKEKRIVYGKERQMFYNPMWNFVGESCDPNFTYCYNAGGAVNFYRYILDQVILSPKMIKYFSKSSLKILTKAKSNTLLNEKGEPDKKTYSDHLPISFNIKEEM